MKKMKLPTIFIEASDLRQKDIDHFLLKRFNKIPVISENIL